MSSGIFAQAQSYGSVCFEKNVNFYQLEKAKSTRGMSARETKIPITPCHSERSDCLAKRNNHAIEESLRFVMIYSGMGIRRLRFRSLLRATTSLRMTRKRNPSVPMPAPAPDTSQSGRGCDAHPPCGVRGW